MSREKEIDKGRRGFLTGAGKAALGAAAAAAVIQVGTGPVGTVEAAPIENLVQNKKPDSLPILAFRGIPGMSEISVRTLDGDKVPFFATKIGNDGFECALQCAGLFAVGVRLGRHGKKKWQNIECELGQYLVVDTGSPESVVLGRGRDNEMLRDPRFFKD